MGDVESQVNEEWYYPKPRFKYWWVCWTAFVLIVFYVMYGFVLAGIATWFEMVILTIAMILYPATSCYKVRNLPERKVQTERAAADIKTSRATSKEDLNSTSSS